MLRVKELLDWGAEVGEKGVQTLKEAGVSIPGVTEEEVFLFIPEVHEKPEVVIPAKAVLVEKVSVDSVDSVEKMEEAKQAVSGIDENPMDGIELHKGEKEAEE